MGERCEECGKKMLPDCQWPDFCEECQEKRDEQKRKNWKFSRDPGFDHGDDPRL